MSDLELDRLMDALLHFQGIWADLPFYGRSGRMGNVKMRGVLVRGGRRTHTGHLEEPL